MSDRPTFSLIVPTRSRPVQLQTFLRSVVDTARHPEKLEVILVVDEDAPVSREIEECGLAIRLVIVPPGRSMGALNTAGYAASKGDYCMLLNDDVIIRTRGWDVMALNCFKRYPDSLVLVHVNDTLMKDYLCTFPLLSRTFCDLAGGICPVEYQRYRIDDHIEDIFNLMAVLGERRAFYLPDVVFEHTNAVEHPEAGRIYLSDPEILAQDAPRFEALFPARKEIALRMLEHIEASSDPARAQARRDKLAAITDPFSLRTTGRQQIMRLPWWRRSWGLGKWFGKSISRLRDCIRRRGYFGTCKAVGRKLFAKQPREAKNSVDKTLGMAR